MTVLLFTVKFPQHAFRRAFFQHHLSVCLSLRLSVCLFSYFSFFLSSCLIFTARVRSTREGNIYTWECLSVHHCGGVPYPRSWGVPYLRSGDRGVPHPRYWGVPHPRSRWGGYSIAGLVGGTPSRSGWGEVPHLRSGGVPGYPQPEMGYPLDFGWDTPGPGTGYPLTWDGVPPRPGMEYPPKPGMGYPPSIAST